MSVPSGRVALVTGVTGQIGFYVAERLRAEGTTVYGLVRQTTLGRQSADREAPYIPIAGDLLDEYSLFSVLQHVAPDEIYNFAAQSYIPASWDQPILTAQYTGLGVVRLLEAIRRISPRCRFVQAGSSELFARAGISPQNERTPIVPRNPYGIAKAFAYHTVQAYREQYGLHASNAVFYTNESPRRSPEFLFRKVTSGVAQIVAGKLPGLTLGNLDVVRDWGYTPDFAEASVRIVRAEKPSDYVIATGDGHSVRELVEATLGLVGLDVASRVSVDPSFHRTAEPMPLIGDPTRARDELGWTAGVRFPALLRIMLAHDLRRLGLEVPFEAPGS